MSEAPIATAPPSAAPDHVQVVAAATPAIVQAAVATPGVQQSHAYAVAANIISALSQELPAILQVTRASSRTSAEVGLGVSLLAAILQAFAPKPAASA